MLLKVLADTFSVCKLPDASQVDFAEEFYFLGKTDEELSLVCRESAVPENALIREDDWRAFRIQGVLDFSLTGILASLSTLLAEHHIGIFAVSTYNTDYILVKENQFLKTLAVLREAGHEII